MMMVTGLGEISKLLANGQSGTTFDAVAIGTSNTAVAKTQTQLVAETTTNGGARQSGASVTSSLQDSNNKTLRFLTTFIFTGTLALFELMVGNNAAANTGVMLLRQVFASVLNVVAQDNLQLQIDIVGTDEAFATDSIITHVGISETNKAIGTDVNAGVAKIKAVAMGSGSTALAQTQTTLVTEITANGLGRSTGVHTITLATVTDTNDTVQVSTQWTVTGTQAVRESGMFDSTTNSAGNMFIRVLYAADLNLINTDVFTQAIRFCQR